MSNRLIEVQVTLTIDMDQGYQYAELQEAENPALAYGELLTEGLAGVLRMWGVLDASLDAAVDVSDTTDEQQA